MNHVDLFSGIGGFALAATWVWAEEYHNLGHSEIEKFPCNVYHKHFPESECLGDITKIDWSRFKGRVDILTGGFPCQPHSVAGKRKGSKDERDLWGECVRALSGIRPRYAIFENVPGIITSEHGKTWERVKVDLDKAGYEGLPVLLSAEAVGAPHRRWRVWIVAHDRNDGCSRWIYKREGDDCGEQNGTRIGERFQSETITDDSTSQDSQPFRSVEREHGEQGSAGNSAPARQRGNGRQILSLAESIRPDIGNSNAPNGERMGRQEGAGQRIQSSKQKSEGQNTGNSSAKRDWGRNWVEVATTLCRVDDGLPRQLDRVQRLKALGNAIVPQCAEVIMRAIKDTD